MSAQDKEAERLPEQVWRICVARQGEGRTSTGFLGLSVCVCPTCSGKGMVLVPAAAPPVRLMLGGQSSSSPMIYKISVDTPKKDGSAG